LPIPPAPTIVRKRGRDNRSASFPTIFLAPDQSVQRRREVVRTPRRGDGGIDGFGSAARAIGAANE